jgi:hypothetical protein
MYFLQVADRGQGRFGIATELTQAEKFDDVVFVQESNEDQG